MTVILYGPAYSTYARTARLALEEKGVAHELHEVDLLTGAGQSPEHLARQPWGKVPAFEHDGFALITGGPHSPCPLPANAREGTSSSFPPPVRRGRARPYVTWPRIASAISLRSRTSCRRL